MFNFFKKKPKFELSNSFVESVSLLAKNECSQEDREKVIEEHYQLNLKYGAEYRGTYQFKFLSEVLNPVPDPILRGLYREKVIEKITR